MTINAMILGLLLFGSLWGVVGAVTGRGGGSFLGFGDVYVCMSTDGPGSSTDGPSSAFPAHPGVSVMSSGFHLCVNHPTGAQRWWYSLEQFPETATGLAVALTTFLVLRQAQVHGLYTPGFAAKLRFMGWFLVVEAVVQRQIESFAGHRLWQTMTDGPLTRNWDFGWLELFAGLALLSLARIMRVGSAMREDLEGVV